MVLETKTRVTINGISGVSSTIAQTHSYAITEKNQSPDSFTNMLHNAIELVLDAGEYDLHFASGQPSGTPNATLKFCSMTFAQVNELSSNNDDYHNLVPFLSRRYRPATSLTNISIPTTSLTQLGESIFFIKSTDERTISSQNHAYWKDGQLVEFCGGRIEGFSTTTPTSSSPNKGIGFTTQTSGTLKIIAISGQAADGRTLTLYDPSGNVKGNVSVLGTTATGSASIQNTSGLREYVLNVPSAGTYYIGMNGSIHIYGLELVEDTKLELQGSLDETKLRMIGTLISEDLESITSIKLVLTLNGKEEEIQITSVYETVNGENGKTAAPNTYYVVFTIKGLSPELTDGVNEYTLSAQMIVTIGSDVHSSRIRTTIICAIPKA